MRFGSEFASIGSAKYEVNEAVLPHSLSWSFWVLNWMEQGSEGRGSGYVYVYMRHLVPRGVDNAVRATELIRWSQFKWNVLDLSPFYSPDSTFQKSFEWSGSLAQRNCWPRIKNLEVTVYESAFHISAHMSTQGPNISGLRFCAALEMLFSYADFLIL